MAKRLGLLLAAGVFVACNGGKAGDKCAVHTDCGEGLVCSKDKTCRPAVAASPSGTATSAASGSGSAAAIADLPAEVPFCDLEAEPCPPGDFEGCAKLCEEGKGESCRVLWKWYGFTPKTKDQHDEAKTKQYQKKQIELDEAACKKGEPCPCSRLFDNYAKGFGADRDPKLAVERAQRACELYDPGACEVLGDIYLNGLPVDVGKDPAKANKLYVRAAALRTAACDKNQLKHCAFLGSMYAGGVGVEMSADKALKLARKACDGGEPLGCQRLGHWYRGGRPGIKKDPRRARDSYQQACKLGHQQSCADVKAVEAENPGG